MSLRKAYDYFEEVFLILKLSFAQKTFLQEILFFWNNIVTQENSLRMAETGVLL